MKLDDFRIRVRSGQGLVARFPTSVLLVAAPDWPTMPAVDRLLDECGQAANGQRLPERLADLLDAEAHKVPAFAALADEVDGLTFFVHGETHVVFTTAQRVMRMSGRRTGGWTGGIPDRVASLEVGPAHGDRGLAPYDDRGDLRDGVVPGGAILLVPRDQTRSAIFRPPAGLPSAPPCDDEAPPAPAPIPAAALDGPPTMVWGIRCKRGHFNDPDARYCHMCGTHMVHQRRDRVIGPRPVLGFLVVDDGSTYKLDADYVIGRNPEVDERVQDGRARGLTLADPEGTVAAAHAAIRLDQWAVFLDDLKPHYGTHLWRPGGAGWSRLDPGQKVMLEPRTHILLGRRTMVFNAVNRR